jgi:hypothetical protein
MKRLGLGDLGAEDLGRNRRLALVSRNPNPNQINEKIQKETTLEIDQITNCQFGRWKLVKSTGNRNRRPSGFPNNKAKTALKLP